MAATTTAEPIKHFGSILSQPRPFRGSDPDPLQYIQHENWRREKEILWRASGVGALHRDSMVTTPTGPWATVCEKILKRLGTGSLLCLCGNRGNGKTQLAAHAVRHYLERFYNPPEETTKAVDLAQKGPPRYARAMEFFLDLKATFRINATQSTRDALVPYVRAGLLVLDEINVRGETSWEDQLLTHMVDSRYAEKMDTILISNHTVQAMEESLGPSILDRAIETGGVIECDWPSFRTM